MDSDYYLDFENRFRGDRKKILNLLSSYKSLVKTAIQGNTSPILIDIGCGRGEWIEQCQDIFYKSIGIESDNSMFKVCTNHGLDVIQGDAIEKLSGFATGSISVITIFHMIEHLEFNQLQKLILECQRVLKGDGILIMETPSIDNLIVSTNLFYIDHTHINPINAESISFCLKKAGFSHVEKFYINGGPLQESKPLKITRVLNGIAQDLCIICTKTELQYNKLFNENTEWQSDLKIGLTTLQAAIEFDLKLESLIDGEHQIKVEKHNHEILLLKQEISLLKARLKPFLYFSYFLKVFAKPLLLIIKSSKKILSIVFNLLLNNEIIRETLLSSKFSIIIQPLIKILGKSSNIKFIQLENKFKKISENKKNYVHYNQKLLFHYEQSKKSRKYKNLLNRRNK